MRHRIELHTAWLQGDNEEPMTDLQHDLPDLTPPADIRARIDAMGFELVTYIERKAAEAYRVDASGQLVPTGPEEIDLFGVRVEQAGRVYEKTSTFRSQSEAAVSWVQIADQCELLARKIGMLALVGR